MNYCTDKFKATILNDVGHVSISDTSVHRVLVVRDELNYLKVSLQTWWCDEVGEPLQPGKGYFMSARHARMICRALSHPELEIGNVSITNTQEYRITKVEADKLFTIDKWWRKSEEEPWTQGKSIAVRFDNVDELCRLLDRACSLTIHAR